MCCFNKLVMVVAVAAALVTSTTFAQDGFRDAGAKMRGNFGDFSSSGTSYSAPLAVRNEPARSSVAQAPQQTRSYSHEPSVGSANAGGCCCPATNAAPAPVQAQRRVDRSFSYEVPAYEAPVGSYRSWSRRSPGMHDATVKARGAY